MNHPLREKYRAHEPAIGTFFNMGDMSCMECMGYTGMDFVIIDTEHGPFDTERMMSLIRAAESVRLAPLVRIATVSHQEIQRAADCGAMGIIAPCLRTVEEYRELVDLAKFPPVGNRGFAQGRGCGFGYQGWAGGPLEEYMAKSNEKLILMPQCETAESLEQIEEIAALDGIDAIFIGPFDLSISLGIPGQFHAPRFQEAVERIVRAFHGADKPVYMYAGTAEESRARLAAGIDGVASSLTSGVLVDAYRKLVDAIKA